MYGPYGSNKESWEQKCTSCGSRAIVAAERNAAQPSVNLTDDFETRARSLLKGDDQKLRNLLALRAEMQRAMTQNRTAASQMNTDALNARNQEMLDRAAKLLGPENFKELFGYSPNERIYLVDPTMVHPTK